MELEACGNSVNASTMCVVEEEVKGDSANAIAEMKAELQRERQRNEELIKRISVLEAQMHLRDQKPDLSNGLETNLSAMQKSYKKFKRQKTETSGQRIEDANVKPLQMKNVPTNIGPTETNPHNSSVNCLADFDATYVSDHECFDENESDIDHKDTDYRENVNSKTEAQEQVLKQDTDDGKNNVLAFDPNLIGNKRTKRNAECQVLMQKNPSKVAFCPKEVKRMIHSETLQLKNAQSHTIRKIIVFASLGIKHGCEEMYHLDFSHFTILQKGQPYVSPENPGEHVLYDNPGVRRKMFYRNHQNPALCPVQVLEDEKAMRPSDASCPSCLFLCIKYGGTTRNLPQNEYVRQRMGRKKLKTFGPVMCEMAMLVHIRHGSFFFKALGITLLFMAGFPYGMIQNASEYKNLDLFQKYYRTDEDAEGEELFLSHPVASIPDDTRSRMLNGKAIRTKVKPKRDINPSTRPHNLHRPSTLQSSSVSVAPMQLGFTGCTSAFQSIPSLSMQIPYNTFPIHPVNGFVPMMYWPPPNANYVSIHPQFYYSSPHGSPLIPKTADNKEKNVEEAESSSSSTGPKEEGASSKL